MALTPRSPIKVNAELNREDVLRDRADGMTFAQLAAKYGKSIRRMRDVVDEAFCLLKDRNDQLARRLAEKNIGRLELLLHAVWDEAMEGSPEHVRTALAIIDRENRMLGIDAVTRTETTTVTVLAAPELYARARQLGLLQEVPQVEVRSVEVEPVK